MAAVECCVIIVLAASEAAQSRLEGRPRIWHAGLCCTATLQSKSDGPHEVVQKAADGSNQQTRLADSLAYLSSNSGRHSGLPSPLH